MVCRWEVDKQPIRTDEPPSRYWSYSGGTTPLHFTNILYIYIYKKHLASTVGGISSASPCLRMLYIRVECTFWWLYVTFVLHLVISPGPHIHCMYSSGWWWMFLNYSIKKYLFHSWMKRLEINFNWKKI